MPDLVSLLGMALATPEGEVLAAVVAAMRATLSPIGFCHYLDPGGRTVSHRPTQPTPVSVFRATGALEQGPDI